MDTKQQVIILSAELSGKSYIENRDRTNELKFVLEYYNTPFNIGQGSYKGEKETSFICLPRNNDELEQIKFLAFNRYKQESILYQDSNGQSYLVYEDGVSVTLGKLRQLPLDQAEKLESYTIMNNQAYAVL